MDSRGVTAADLATRPRQAAPPVAAVAEGPAAANSVLRRIAVAVIGMTVLITGVALIVLPGPAFLVVPCGLAILATEFVWARKLQIPLHKHLLDLRDRSKNLLARSRW